MPIIPNNHDASFRQLLHPRDLIPHLSHLLRREPPTPHPFSTSPATIPHIPTLSSLFRRQVILTPVPTVYQGLNTDPAPGTVIGIVLGSVAAFLLLVWLFWSLSNRSGGNAVVAEEEYVVRRPASPRSRPRSSRRSEVRQRSPRSPQRIIVENRNIVEDRRSSMPPPPAPPSSAPPPPVVERERIVVEERVERRVDGDDIVEVIEEQSSVSPPRRKGSRRDRSVPSGQYRPVDPGAFAGGDYPPRDVYGSRRYRR